MISLSLIVLLSSAFLVHLITDRVLLPEQWLLGLKWCLPPQIDTSQAREEEDEDQKRISAVKRKKKSSSASSNTNSSNSTSKRRFSAASELYIRLESIQQDVLPHLYYFKEFDRLISIMLMLVLNYLFCIVYAFFHGEYNYFFALFSSDGKASTINDAHVFESLMKSSTYTLWCSIMLIALVCYSSSQSTIIGLKKTLRSLTIVNREDLLFILCFVSGVLSFLLSFTILGSHSGDSKFIFSMSVAGDHLKSGLQQVCKDNSWERCVQFMDNNNKMSNRLLWIVLRSSCAVLSSYVIFAVFMPIVRVVRCHVHLGSTLMNQHYHSSPDGTNSSAKKSMYSWLNILLPLLIVMCYYEPFMSQVLGIESREHQLATLFLLTITSSLLGFFGVRAYVQSYLFYTVQYAVEDATEEADAVKQLESSKHGKHSTTNRLLIRNSILQQKLLTYFKYVLLVALQATALPILQFSSAVLLHVRGGFSLAQMILQPNSTLTRSQAGSTVDHWGQFLIHICGFICFWANLCAFLIGVLCLFWYGSSSTKKKEPTTTHNK